MNDFGMDVTFSTNGGCIAEDFGNTLDDHSYIFLCLAFRGHGFEFLGRHCGENCSDPGAKIFGGEIGARYLAQIIIHIGGLDVLGLFPGDVREKLLSGHFLTGTNDFGHARIMESDFMMLSALSSE